MFFYTASDLASLVEVTSPSRSGASKPGTAPEAEVGTFVLALRPPPLAPAPFFFPESLPFELFIGSSANLALSHAAARRSRSSKSRTIVRR